MNCASCVLSSVRESRRAYELLFAKTKFIYRGEGRVYSPAGWVEQTYLLHMLLAFQPSPLMIC